MKKIPPLTKKRRSLADLSPDSLAAALYHRELAEQRGQDIAKGQAVQHDRQASEISQGKQ
jgi:hypothetical protein